MGSSSGPRRAALCAQRLRDHRHPRARPTGSGCLCPSSTGRALFSVPLVHFPQFPQNMPLGFGFRFSVLQKDRTIQTLSSSHVRRTYFVYHKDCLLCLCPFQLDLKLPGEGISFSSSGNFLTPGMLLALSTQLVDSA